MTDEAGQRNVTRRTHEPDSHTRQKRANDRVVAVAVGGSTCVILALTLPAEYVHPAMTVPSFSKPYQRRFST
jgi:hypothetical protein